jgi:hypothetical protein
MEQRSIKNANLNQPSEASDPVLSMLGIGRHLWETESGDSFVERLRSEEAPPITVRHESAAQNTTEVVWKRIESHQGEEFRTVTGLPFTHSVEGAGIWFFRDGRRINRKLTRAQTEVAIARCPLSTTTEIKDLIDYPYLFALLMDARIRGESF